jgi:hypothetical protein
VGRDDELTPLPRLPTGALVPLEATPPAAPLADDLTPPPIRPRLPYLPPRLGLPPPRGQRMREPASPLCQSALAAIVQALRAKYTYLEGSEQRSRYLDQAHQKLTALLSVAPEVELLLEPDRILIKEDVVYFHPDPREGLAGQLYGAGLRSVVLRKAPDLAELDRLITAWSTDFSKVDPPHLSMAEVLARAELEHVEVEALGSTPAVVRPAVPEPERPAPRPAAAMPPAQRRSGLQVVPARVAREALARLTADELTADASLFAPRSPSPRAPSFAALSPPDAPAPRAASSGADLVRVITRVEQVVDELYGRSPAEEATLIGDASSNLLSSLRSLVEDYEQELDQEPTAITEPAHLQPAAREGASRPRRRRRSRARSDSEPTQG